MSTRGSPPPTPASSFLDWKVAPFNLLYDAFAGAPWNDDILAKNGTISANASAFSWLYLILDAHGEPESPRRRHIQMSTYEHVTSQVGKSTFVGRNLIMGIAVGIDDRSLAIFVKSAREIGKDVEILLFVDYPAMTSGVWAVGTQARKLLEKERVHVVEYVLNKLEPSYLRAYHPSSLRWVCYHRFLTNYKNLFGKKFSKILHVDVRDVFFSANPFSHVDALDKPRKTILTKESLSRLVPLNGKGKGKADGASSASGVNIVYSRVYGDSDGRCYQNTTTVQISPHYESKSKVVRWKDRGSCEGMGKADKGKLVLAFKEEDAPLLGDCEWNSGWVRDCFGPVVLDLLRASDISCSGVVLGTASGMLHYIKTMSEILQGRHALSPFFPKCERNGVDQGIHNVLLHAGIVPGLQHHSQSTFPSVVSHMQSDLYAEVSTGTPPLVTSASGEGKPVSIVHQYDRLESLQKRLAEHYVDWMDINNWLEAWEMPSAGCGAFKRFRQFDLLKGQCGYGSFRALTPDQCCSSCSKKENCTGFTYASGICWFKRCSEEEIARTFTSFSLRLALGLPLDSFIAVADENLTPVSTLVVSAVLKKSLANSPSPPVSTLLKMMHAMRREHGANDKPTAVGGFAATSNESQLVLNYLEILPQLDKVIEDGDEHWVAEWGAKSECNVFMHISQYDLLRGVCDLKSVPDTSPETCCNACSSVTGCTGFTFANNMCWLKACDSAELGNVYLRFTVYAALNLPLHKFLKDEESQSGNAPTINAVTVTGLLSSQLPKSTLEADIHAMIDAVRKETGNSFERLTVGRGELSLSTASLVKDYIDCLPKMRQQIDAGVVLSPGWYLKSLRPSPSPSLPPAQSL